MLEMPGQRGSGVLPCDGFQIKGLTAFLVSV